MPDMSERDRETARKLLDTIAEGCDDFTGACSDCTGMRVSAIAAALTAARQEQAEADAKLLESRVERCYELAAGSLTGEAKMAWMAEGAQLQAAADAIRDRARTTGGE